MNNKKLNGKNTLSGENYCAEEKNSAMSHEIYLE